MKFHYSMPATGWAGALLTAWLACSPMAHAADSGSQAASYAAMLNYLDSSSIDGHAMQGVSGISSTNIAAGDNNLQANLHALSVGNQAQSLLRVHQELHNDYVSAPGNATASIGGSAFANGRGIASINQASGNGNAEVNGVAVTLANTGIREATDGALSSTVSAWAGGQSAESPHSSTPASGTRSVAVQGTAMRGFSGVLQLNQIAGSGNATGNLLLLSAPSGSP